MYLYNINEYFSIYSVKVLIGLNYTQKSQDFLPFSIMNVYCIYTIEIKFKTNKFVKFRVCVGILGALGQTLKAPRLLF